MAACPCVLPSPLNTIAAVNVIAAVNALAAHISRALPHRHTTPSLTDATRALDTLKESTRTQPRTDSTGALWSRPNDRACLVTHSSLAYSYLLAHSLTHSLTRLLACLLTSLLTYYSLRR